MKHLLTALTLVCCLALTAPVWAATQTFGPDFSRFTVEVPDGWTAKANDGGCQITSADEGSSVSIQVAKNGGKSAAELAKLIGDNLGGKIVKTENDGPNQSSIYAEIDGVRVVVMVFVDGDKFAAFTMAGSDTDTMQKIAGSLQDAK
ncbi:MAG: hypothetical protein IJU37_07660 [Desulfovibrio sp.]|nr:hypothetical protein [Desulfovibrio sp.]